MHSWRLTYRHGEMIWCPSLSPEDREDLAAAGWSPEQIALLERRCDNEEVERIIRQSGKSH